MEPGRRQQTLVGANRPKILQVKLIARCRGSAQQEELRQHRQEATPATREPPRGRRQVVQELYGPERRERRCVEETLYFAFRHRLRHRIM